MIVALTGGTGQLGSHAIDALLAAGHQVRVFVRPDKGRFSLPPNQQLAHTITVAPLDIQGLTQALQGCDAVVHAAAALTGDEVSQHAVTVEGSRALLTAMASAGVRRLVGIGSLSVYNHDAVPLGGAFNESTPLETQPAMRDVYARCKLAQDHLFAQFAHTPGAVAITLRPGIFYTERSLWTFALGKPLGRHVWLVIGPLTTDCEVPMVHVKDVASAIVLALAAGPELNGQNFNLVEQPAPSAPVLLAALHRSHPYIRLVRLPWWLHRLLAHMASPILGRKAPGLLRPCWLAARFTRVHYDSQLARQLLGWQPKHHALDLAQTASTPHTP